MTDHEETLVPDDASTPDVPDDQAMRYYATLSWMMPLAVWLIPVLDHYGPRFVRMLLSNYRLWCFAFLLLGGFTLSLLVIVTRRRGGPLSIVVSAYAGLALSCGFICLLVLTWTGMHNLRGD